MLKDNYGQQLKVGSHIIFTRSGSDSMQSGLINHIDGNQGQVFHDGYGTSRLDLSRARRIICIDGNSLPEHIDKLAARERQSLVDKVNKKNAKTQSKIKFQI